MNIGFTNRIGFVTLLLLGSVGLIYAEEPARSRGAQVVFSGPTSDATSTNLNDLRTSAKPFQDLESGLKQPFQGDNDSRPGPNFKEHRRLQQQAKPQSRQTLKDDLNQRAEEMFLNPSLYDAAKEDEAIFQLDKKSKKNPLEHFNDHQNLERAALTNRAGGTRLFGDQNLGRPDEMKGDGKFVKPFKTGRSTEPSLNESLSQFPNIGTNSAVGHPEQTPSLRSPDAFGRNFKDPISRPQTDAQARMEEFKRVLEGPRYKAPAVGNAFAATPANNYRSTTGGNSASATTSSRTSPASSSANEWSAFKPQTKTDPKNDFVKSAGIVGTPDKLQALPEFPAATAAVPPAMGTTPPPTAPSVSIKKKPGSTFKLPQRRF